MKTEIKIKYNKIIELDNEFFKYGTSGWDTTDNWEVRKNQFGYNYVAHITGNTDTIGQSDIPFLIGKRYKLIIYNKNNGFNEPLMNGYPFTISFGNITSYTFNATNFFSNTLYEYIHPDGYEFIITPHSLSNLSLQYIGLYLQSTLVNNVLDLYDDFGLNLNMSVNDIRDISKRNSTYSKTIKIPATKNNNLIFDNQQDINNISFLSSNYLYKPIPVDLFYSSVLIRSGYIKLINIINDDFKPEYEIQFYGEYADLASTLSDQYIFNNDDSINDINVSEYGHIFNMDNVFSSWSNFLTSGFTYPIIDYTGDHWLTYVPLSYLKPALSVKIIFDKIIEDAGFTYESSFLNSEPFINMLNPWTGSNILADENALYDDRKIRTYRSGAYVNSNNVIKFDIEYTDPSNQYNNTGSVVSGIDPWSFKIKNSGIYNFRSQIGLRIDYYYYYSINPFTINVTSKLQDVESGDIVGIGSTLSVTIPSGSLSTTSFIISGVTYTDSNVELEEGHQYRVILSWSGVQNWSSFLIHVLGGWPPGSEGTTFFKLFPSRISLKAFEGDYIDISRIFGDKKIKKIDYITSIIKMFNLIVDEDPIKYKHLLIEPNNIYYSGGTYLDWTDKVDTSQKIDITKLKEYVDKSVYLSHKKDEDTLNVNFTSKYNKIYGAKTHQNEIKSSDLIKIETIFSPTVLGYFGNTRIVTSKIFKRDYAGTIINTTDDTVEELDYNPRILYYNNLLLPPGGDPSAVIIMPEESPPIMLDGFFASPYNRLPYAGHVDNPYNDVYDYNFGNNKGYFFDITGGTITYQNLWWMYYRNFLDDMLDHDSVLVKMDILLNENDISNFKFSDTIRINNTSYIVNKIIDWNPGELCKIELLKLSRNYLKLRSSGSGIPIDAYYNPIKKYNRSIDLTKPDVSVPIVFDASGNTNPIWDVEELGEFPITYKGSNKYTKNSNNIISGVYNNLTGVYNCQVVGDYNDIDIDTLYNISGQTFNTSENIIIIGSNNKIS